MKKRTERKMNTAVALILGVQVVGVVFLFSLRRGHPDLFADGTLKLEIVPAPRTFLPHAHAMPEGQSVRVSGRLRRRDESGADQHGTIVVAVVSPEGERRYERTGKYLFSAQRPHGGGFFDVRLDTTPAGGSTVLISWSVEPDLAPRSPAGPNDSDTGEVAVTGP